MGHVSLPSRERIHIPPYQKENHRLKSALRKGYVSSLEGTPLKINMEPKNQTIEKENHLPSTSIFGFNVSFRGCTGGFVQLAQ